MPTSVQAGYVVRLNVTFVDFANAPTDVDVGSLSLTIFSDAVASSILVVIPEAAITHDGDGMYHFDWIPTQIGNIAYQWSATIDAEPTGIRRIVTVTQV